MPTVKKEPTQDPDTITITAPESVDGPAVHALIAACPPLDTNSLYLNLLQCSHFAQTCAIARRAGEVVGFLSAYLEPESPETLFVWQVAVRDDARGRGLAKRMLLDVLSRPSCAGVKGVEATITEDNAGSWALFTSFARGLGAETARRPMFERETHFAGKHDTEVLIAIGPFAPGAPTKISRDTHHEQH